MEFNQETDQLDGFSNKDETVLYIKVGPMAAKGPVEIREIPLNKIKLGKNSRMQVSEDEIAGLMQSIKEVGLLQPIGVTKSGNSFEIVYGNRRFLAVSKLGKAKIPAVVHSNKNVSENDLQNLTENLQRRNISLIEAGRYIQILRDSGLSAAEIAVRLGVSKAYIQSCITAFQEVPKEHQKDLEVKTVHDRKRTPGKISISTARAIVSARATYRLSKDEEELLYKAAKKDDSFEAQNIPKYAAAVKQGSKDPVRDVPKTKHVSVQFYITEDEYNRLYEKHVVKGHYKSMSGFFVSILKGEKNERVKIL